jgi:molybdate transport system permease protein
MMTRRWTGRPGGVALLAAPFALFLALPVAVLVVRSVAGRALVDALGSPVVLDALWLSFVTTAVSLVLIVFLGMPLAYVLARHRFRGSSIVESIVDLPIVLPPSVAGLALLLVFGRRGLLGEPLAELGLTVPFTTAAVILAQVFVAGPFFVRSARAGLAAVAYDLEEAASDLGASRWAVFRGITMPLAAPALTAGLVLCWARALGEFGATIMFAGSIEGRTQTLPLVVYAEFQAGDLEASIAAAAILAMAAFAVLVAVRGLRFGRTALDVRVGA